MASHLHLKCRPFKHLIPVTSDLGWAWRWCPRWPWPGWWWCGPAGRSAACSGSRPRCCPPGSPWRSWPSSSCRPDSPSTACRVKGHSEKDGGESGRIDIQTYQKKIHWMSLIKGYRKIKTSGWLMLRLAETKRVFKWLLQRSFKVVVFCYNSFDDFYQTQMRRNKAFDHWNRHRVKHRATAFLTSDWLPMLSLKSLSRDQPRQGTLESNNSFIHLHPCLRDRLLTPWKVSWRRWRRVSLTRWGPTLCRGWRPSSCWPPGQPGQRSPFPGWAATCWCSLPPGKTKSHRRTLEESSIRLLLMWLFF